METFEMEMVNREEPSYEDYEYDYYDEEDTYYDEFKDDLEDLFDKTAKRNTDGVILIILKG